MQSPPWIGAAQNNACSESNRILQQRHTTQQYSTHYNGSIAQRFFFLTNFLGEDSAVLCCLQDLGSPSGLESNSSAVKVWSPNFWATREFPTRQGLRKAYFTMSDGGRPSLETPPTPVCLCWQLVALGCLSFSY